MPASFWIFFVICIASFVVAVDDHREAWDDFKTSTGRESKQSDKKDEQRDAQYGEVTNQLAQVVSEYSQATNALAMATNAAAMAQKAVAPKAPKQQLIELLNSIDPRLLPSLKTHPKVIAEGSMTESQYQSLRTLSAYSGMSEYISSPKWQGTGFGAGGTSIEVHFEIYSSLAQ